MKINAAPLEALGKELPWLPGLIPSQARNGGDFLVEMIDLDTLSLSPNNLYHVSRDEHDIPTCRILLLDEEGVEIGGVGEYPEASSGLSFSRQFPFFRLEDYLYIQVKEENVEMALKRFATEAHRIRYILEIKWVFVTLHKMPRSMKDLSTWLEQKQAETLDTLNRSLNQA